MHQEAIQPGLLILHGNRLEHLAEAVFAWLARHPLAPLEAESFLVQSNGMAEWLKMSLATAHGICAATRVELPARFIWRCYRAVLGRNAVPPQSALDKTPLTWRLMQLLPVLVGQPGFEPVASFLGDGDPARRLQLARRLADLYDQYQVYRADWLQDWAAGLDRLRGPTSLDGEGAPTVPPDQRWQPALWRAVLASLAPDDGAAARALLHQRFLQALQADERPAGLPRRVVVFGSTHVPQQTLEAVAALARHCQVLMAVPNPCRYHWADIIDGRELLRATRPRHALRGERDLFNVPLQEMHAHGHPLLAAWGRQGRDFVRQLDAFDDAQQARQRFDIPRIDLFDEVAGLGEGGTLLQQVQARIRDLVPLAEHPPATPAADDRSIVFHLAHGAQREVEILHDQLLQLLAHPPGGRPLAPRDIVVMVPDIDLFAPAIRSVFGQHARGAARHIPWGIADQKERGHAPLLVALEWLLRAPQQRFGHGELRDLLDVPALARRFGLAARDLPTLVAWISDAGIRWGLHAEQRGSLGLAACGEANTWAFGLRRLLLGYATGALAAMATLDEDGELAAIEPSAEVGGLDAGLVGVLHELLGVVEAWWRDASQARSPAAWGERLRALLAAVFAAGDDAERALLSALDQALSDWLQACERAGFADAVDIAVVREAWLDGVDEPGVARRFRAGGVTFCTLLPLRAIPFEVVCLLGMNEGDYPRRGARSDFDLLALPGQARPGDRSRRDDDRQLMLDALLSARRVLYVSWAGRSQRDNQAQPPSVLVDQLRDYLVAGWGKDVVRQRSTEHPLQPFSRRYFEPGGLFTYAGEWRGAHVEGGAPVVPAASARVDTALRLNLAMLAGFLRNPVQAWFRHRLQVAFDEIDAPTADDEDFDSRGLQRWQLLDEVLRESRAPLAVTGVDATAIVAAQVARLRRAGRLPLAGPGRLIEVALMQTLEPMLACWQAERAAWPEPGDKRPLRLADPQDAGLVLDDWLLELRQDGAGHAVWLALQAGGIADKKRLPRADKLFAPWLRGLAAAACGGPVGGIVIGSDAVARLAPLQPDEARDTLLALMRACRDGLLGSAPWPTAARTGLAWLTKDPAKAAEAYDGAAFSAMPGEGREPCLARLYPDFATLAAQPGFEEATRRLYEPCIAWLAAAAGVEPLQANDEPDHG
ncbi:RecBCD enzyme subunit RecC [Rubrivivax sp. A210]|uniref:exodeoxyribonuclease V subunit gamma n=1 Tax=Rubrivivax sp. A210 TaxID=2772301 RepID=UPI0019190F77|nr:exodeoxyribonuclease V subunit gamma [Rubrivivax sp. A210]CAD5371681.1 RecBCD enzyme subunit RecC [Rubrivivax sp. A210]